MLPVTEITVFRVSDATEGLKTAHAIIQDARQYTDAIIDSDTYQATNDPKLIVQRITWRSLKDAKETFAASESFPNMQKMMGLMTEQILFDYFYLTYEKN